MAPISSPVPTPQCRHAALDAAVLTERVLERTLRSFIQRELLRALGADMYEAFLPSRTESAAELLRFIRSKWIGVFADSPAGSAGHLVDGARDALLAHGRSSTPVTEIHSATTVVSSTEALLLALGARGAAARVAEIWASATGAPSPAMHPPKNASSPCVDEDAAMMDVDVGNSASAAVPLSVNLPPIQRDRMPVVLDGSNLAWAHGQSSRFSMYGAAEAFVYFRLRGHAVALVLPEGRMRIVSGATRDVENAAMEWIQRLRGTESLVLTPDADYDDVYITHLARRVGAIVVSNDRFTDQVHQAGAQGADEAQRWREWISACRVSFTFQGDIFVPNPSFDFERALKTARTLALPAD